VGWFHGSLKLSEQATQRSFQAQTVLNKLLNISLGIIPLEAVLTRIIDELISLPWFALESKGAVFVVEDGAAVLEMMGGHVWVESEPGKESKKTA